MKRGSSGWITQTPQRQMKYRRLHAARPHSSATQLPAPPVHAPSPGCATSSAKSAPHRKPSRSSAPFPDHASRARSSARRFSPGFTFSPAPQLIGHDHTICLRFDTGDRRQFIRDAVQHPHSPPRQRIRAGNQPDHDSDNATKRIRDLRTDLNAISSATYPPQSAISIFSLPHIGSIQN